MDINNVPLETAINYVAGAYIGIWVIFFAYLAVMGSKVSNLRKQVEALTEAVERQKEQKSVSRS